MKIRLPHREPRVRLSRVHQLIAEQFEERLRVAAESWDAGFIAGIETATKEVAA